MHFLSNYLVMVAVRFSALGFWSSWAQWYVPLAACMMTSVIHEPAGQAGAPESRSCRLESGVQTKPGSFVPCVCAWSWSESISLFAPRTMIGIFWSSGVELLWIQENIEENVLSCLHFLVLVNMDLHRHPIPAAAQASLISDDSQGSDLTPQAAARPPLQAFNQTCLFYISVISVSFSCYHFP